MALNFNHFAAEANAFMKDYTKALNLKDKEQGGRVLSAILHALREVISVEESLQLIAQFPMFLKAVYVNGWTIHKRKRIKTMPEFIELVRKFGGVSAPTDFKDDFHAENYITSTFIELRRYISLGELEDIRTELPKELKSMVYYSAMF